LGKTFAVIRVVAVVELAFAAVRDIRLTVLAVRDEASTAIVSRGGSRRRFVREAAETYAILCRVSVIVLALTAGGYER
jgi:hypothetical protein